MPNHSIADNPLVDGHALTERWIQLVCLKVAFLWGYYVGPSDIVHLDSTTAVKFSRHVILHVRRPVERRGPAGGPRYEEVLFRDNMHVGALVDLIMADMTERCVGPPGAGMDYMEYSRVPRAPFRDMWLRNKDGGHSCFVDTAVYTRNRAFR
jgi:hypothetical protein